jgi:hypothetical protein
MAMSFRYIIHILLAAVTLLAMTTNAVAGQEEPQPISPQEKEEVQRAAQLFVRRMQQTRDVAPLINELFAPNFISHFVSGDCECIPPQLYSRLSRTERLRWFVALNNFSYLITLDVLQGPTRNPEDENYLASTFKRILPDKTAEELQNLMPQENDFQIEDYQAFRSLLIHMEEVLAEARAHLIQQGIEQTPEFQRKLDDKVTDRGIEYRARAYIGGGNIKDCEPLIGFPTNQKFYRVETPLMMGVILTKVNEQMKIVRLTYVDGD